MQTARFANRSGAEPVDDDRVGAATRPLTGNLLLVDPDEFLAEMIEAGLRLARPKWKVIAVRTPAEAREVLERHSELDAIVTEIVFDDSPDAGKAFIAEVERRWPEIPVFVMTARDPEDTGGLETGEFIAKPPDMDFLVGRIDRSIRRQRESRVRGISLPTFLQILELERMTCTVHVSSGGRVGEIHFRAGHLVHALAGAAEGTSAFFELVSMTDYTFRVVDKCGDETTITAPLGSLLMEWSVREDHARREENE